jgi:purine-binding chemotaxis protein CheW
MAEAALEMDTQYLTFTLREELFAVNISKVREVIEFATVNAIPGMPSYMRGVINLRGAVVPVMDLRQKFGMGETKKGVDTCVIITEVMMGDKMLVLGALADAVQEVFDLLPDQIEPPPSIGTSIDTSFIKGMGKKGDDFVILLDIDKVFSTEEMATLAGEEANEEAD